MMRLVQAVQGLGADANVKSWLGAAMAAHLEETLLDESDYTSAHIHCFPYVPEGLRQALSASEGIMRRSGAGCSMTRLPPARLRQVSTAPRRGLPFSTR
jgi:hypothetical protein